ncbi:hypothetical protein [Erythrobacter sp. Alg231-14]|uniref:hypothetical protein n=1 Tax=Erythrobacter sp. Alg231-14 TaxID=1922225 RepID=UPI000D55ABD5
MQDADVTLYVAIAFPFFFFAMWIVTTALLPRISGWARLEDELPDRPDPAHAKLRFEAFYLGRGKLGVSYRGCVTFEVCQTGLRVRVWKLFAPFSRPIFIPWNAVETEFAKVFFVQATRMKIGQGGEFWMTIPLRSAHNIARASGGRFIIPDRG